MRERRRIRPKRSALQQAVAAAALLGAAATAMTVLESTNGVPPDEPNAPLAGLRLAVAEPLASIELPEPLMREAAVVRVPGTLLADEQQWSLFGRVIDDRLIPLAGVTVTAGSIETATDREGAFELLLPRPTEPLRIAARLAGHAPRETWLSHDDPGAGASLPVLVLPRCAAISGRICAPGEIPIGGAVVTVRLNSPTVASRCYATREPGSALVIAVTAPDGSYAFDGLDIGVGWLQASVDGLISWCGAVELEPASVAHCGTFIMEPATRLEGLVVDASGAAIPGAFVLARRNKPGNSVYEELTPPAPVEGPPAGVITDSAGRFRFDALGPGRWVVGAIPPEGSVAWPGLVPADAGPRSGPVVVKLPDAPRRLAGLVLDEREQPAVGVRVSVSVLGLLDTVPARSTTTDAAGRFELDVPPRLGLHIWAGSSSLKHATATVDPRVDSEPLLKIRSTPRRICGTGR